MSLMVRNAFVRSKGRWVMEDGTVATPIESCLLEHIETLEHALLYLVEDITPSLANPHEVFSKLLNRAWHLTLNPGEQNDEY